MELRVSQSGAGAAHSPHAWLLRWTAVPFVLLACSLFYVLFTWHNTYSSTSFWSEAMSSFYTWHSESMTHILRNFLSQRWKRALIARSLLIQWPQFLDIAPKSTHASTVTRPTHYSPYPPSLTPWSALRTVCTPPSIASTHSMALAMYWNPNSARKTDSQQIYA